MKGLVKKKKTARPRKKSKSTIFHLCDLMCEGLEIVDNQAGDAPVPVCLLGEKDDPILVYWNDSVFMYWNFWRCFVSALKKKLSEILTDEELSSTQGKILFSLFFEYETGSHTFSIHQEWVAQRLGIRPQTHFFAENSTEVFIKLISLCFEDGEENPMVREFQKLTAVKKTLNLPQRCELNLILASLADKLPTIAAKRN